MKTETAFLIYRPVMDYEESETAYLICSTQERADAVLAEMVAYANGLLASLRSLYDDTGDRLESDKWDEACRFNREKIEACRWPFGVDLEQDIDQWNYDQNRTRFNASCIAIRELPLV